MDEENENPLQLLLKMRDGCVEMNEELCDDQYEIDEIEIDPQQYYHEMYYTANNKRSSSKRQQSSGSTRSKVRKISFQEEIGATDMLTLEEQKEIEEPIEIDMRNIYKTYGINPIETKQKLFRKTSNDIINFSIGEAFMKFAHGKNDEAISLLFEVIRMNPLNPEPYDALGDIYRRLGNYNKALEFYLLGIEFNQNDSERWAELAELAYFNKMYKSALKFYTKAVRLSPRTLNYYIKKSNIFEELKQYENAYKTYEKLMSILEPEDYKIIISIAFRIANLLLFQLNSPSEALAIIENIIVQHSIEQDSNKFVSFRLYLASYFDLLLTNGQIDKLITKFIKYNLIKTEQLDVIENVEQCRDFIFDNLDENLFNTNDIVLQSKLICACLYFEKHRHMDAIKKFYDKFSEIENETAQEMVYRPIIVALMNANEYEQAHVYSAKLVKNFRSSKYWYWYGLCLRKLGRDEDAVEAYGNAIRYDQHNYDAVNELSDLCNRIGIPERALDKVNLDHLKVDINLLMNRCDLLFVCKRWAEFISHCRLLLSSNLYFIENWRDLAELVARSTTSFSLRKSARSLRRKCSLISGRTELIGGRLNKEQFFDFWKKSIFVLLNYLHEHDEAVRWAFSGLMSSYSHELMQPILLITFRTCIDAKVRRYTFWLGKLLIKEFRNSGKLWYAFSAMLSSIYQDYRHKRFCIRLWSESPENVNILLVNGHIAFESGRYLHALAIYLMIYRMRTSYRYDSFHVALAYMHLICQKHTLDKCSLFSQMIAFLHDYMLKIGKCQETYYNLARTFHQLGFIPYAIELYQAALQTPLKVHDNRFDLSPEIAFNLSQIYRNSGNHNRANELISKFCTI
ncbi:general transcription factor 3C polypeptide 3 [Dermatophagoides pteronyssinus]|uniref:general transcription factor 3C polypeptide 3 n=1 Tax=Dermatophagoides pteronyssinus TaxID=6956 RepID=UPI003F668597